MIEHKPSRPQGLILETLKGKVSEPVQTESEKPITKGQVVSVRLVQEGSGMIGLKDAQDNKEWAGIFNHFVTTARVATFLAEKLGRSGENVDPNIVLNTILVSHSGRRQWDEANWYPKVVENAQDKVKRGDTKLTLDIVKNANIQPEIVDVIEAHGIGGDYPFSRMDTWEKKLAMYSDFRVSQTISPLKTRFEDLSRRAVPAGRITQEMLDQIENWAYGVEREIFSKPLLKSDGTPLKPEDITNDYPTQPRWERHIGNVDELTL